MAVDIRIIMSIIDRYSVWELDFRLRYCGIGGGRIIEGGSYCGDCSDGLTDPTDLAGGFDPRRYHFSETSCVCVNMIASIIIVVLNLAESCASGDYKKRFSVVNYVNKGQISINYRCEERCTVILKFEYIVFVI